MKWRISSNWTTETLKNATLDLMPISSKDQIIPVIDNEMDKPDQLACIRYKNQNVLA